MANQITDKKFLNAIRHRQQNVGLDYHFSICNFLFVMSIKTQFGLRIGQLNTSIDVQILMAIAMASAFTITTMMATSLPIIG
ncbi:hypothetical protein ACO0LB_16770 [Undibacterium sp. SXout7W]|uniref:hypothetical protein n=1 Tax=Undibacterium sp. SXout7W TaxID=3413049 RepID=UPI003BF006CC